MTNGNVYVHIPLLSYPQRGKDLDLSFSIMANARVWGCGVPVGAGINSSGTCVWMMADETGASVAGEAAAGAYVASDQNGFVAPTYATLPNLSCSGPNGSTVPCPTPWQFWNYAYYSPGGGVHYFYSNQGGPLGSGYDTGAIRQWTEAVIRRLPPPISMVALSTGGA